MAKAPLWVQIQQADDVELWLMLGVLMLVAVIGFFLGFRRLWLARVIEDAPTARIRSAPQGYVELVGAARAMAGEAIIAPLSKTPCCWFRYTIESKRGSEWRIVRKETSGGLFLVADATGECVIDPDGAEVAPGAKRVWYGDGDEPITVVMPPRGAEGIQLGPVVMRGSGAMFTSSHRYTEELIVAGDPLYALGEFKTLDDIDHHQSRSEMTAAILREWKRDQRRLMHRFDHDRDGVIDPAEWEGARRLAEQEAARDHAEQLAHQHVHTLRRPQAKDRPFLLSTLPQFKLVRRYRWESFGGFVLFLAAAGLLAWIASLRLG
jgi:hypothetical protein